MKNQVSRQRKLQSRKNADQLAREQERFLKAVHLRAAGIDIGDEEHWVCVPEVCSEQPVRRFRSYTQDLKRLADWLEACGIETIAMESTGVYWIPLFELLEERGFTVLLVNSRHVKNVPGRKSDVLDCQWIQKLHTFGLLRASFRPSEEIVALRAIVRHRDQLVQSAARCIQRMQKALNLMNLKLHRAVSDITGGTGLRIIRDIVAGQTDPDRLAEHRDRRCKASAQEIADALTGHYREEHLFVLQQSLELYDLHQEKLRACDTEMEKRIHSLEATCETPKTTLPAAPRRRTPRPNEPRFDIRSPLFRLAGNVDLTQLPGIGPYNLLKLVSEVGLDMTRWPSEKHFAAWLTLAPCTRQSGQRLLRAGTTPSENKAAQVFRLAAMSVGRSNHALGAFYRRLAARVGKPKAITATARKIAILFYRTLRDKTELVPQTAADYDASHKHRMLRSLRRRARNLGLELIDSKTGLVMT